METERKIKQEERSPLADVKPEVGMDQSQVDFSRLYGDLCRKLLSTPVGEIFPDVVTGSASKHVTNSTGCASPSGVHPAFPAFSTMASSPINYLPGLYSPNHLLMMAGGLPNELNTAQPLNSSRSNPTLGGASIKNGCVEMTKNNPVSPGSDVSTDFMENIDVQKLVDEFRITLERYGVSQRFAARFIMQDTSQGNLSFLMEKGRNKKWEELSPRGRLPYIKMKAWLESKEQQMATLEMLKYSQESRKNSSRESYNRRERFTMFQLNVLCRLFEENSNPPMNIRNAVAIRLGIPLDRVNVWFQNQRARGFPARKILQQSLFDNEGDPYLAIDVENMKDKINEAHFLPQNIPVNTGSPTYINKSEQDCSKRPSPKASEFASPVQTRSVTSLKSEPVENVLPLDLSASSFSKDDKIKKSETYSPAPQVPYTEDRYKYSDSLNFESNTVQTNEPAAQTNPTTRRGTSGAAKRKRGSKPQQIIPFYKKEADNEHDCDKTNETKRRKVSEISSPESKYTYLLDTADIEHESVSPNSYPSNGYDYVIKSETSPNGNSVHNSPENTKHYKFNERCLGESPHTEQKHLDSNLYEGIDSNNSALLGGKSALLNTKNIKTDKEETLNPKSVELFKAMCASLVIKDQSQSDSNLSEPELD